jgi:hypothetical protein
MVVSPIARNGQAVLHAGIAPARADENDRPFSNLLRPAQLVLDSAFRLSTYGRKLRIG